VTNNHLKYIYIENNNANILSISLQNLTKVKKKKQQHFNTQSLNFLKEIQLQKHKQKNYGKKNNFKNTKS
jgi:hypothetical protein